MTNITKLENGNVSIETDGLPTKYYSSLTNTVINITTANNISVTSKKYTLVLPFDQIDKINGATKPITIQLTAELLATSVFN